MLDEWRLPVPTDTAETAGQLIHAAKILFDYLKADAVEVKAEVERLRREVHGHYAHVCERDDQILARALKRVRREVTADQKPPPAGVDPRPVRPLELPAYAWRSVKQYLYRHESWCKVGHYGLCGQSCPCCRFAAGDLFGACEVGLGVRTLASVSVAVRMALTVSSTE